MKIPSGLKPGLWGAAAGAIAMAIIGFAQLGWTTEANAGKMAKETADTAVVAALVPFCVVKAKTDPNTATLVTFQAEQSSYSRGEIVTKAGWTTFDGKTAGSSALARACADSLHITKAG